jgi:hypothetical protein
MEPFLSFLSGGIVGGVLGAVFGGMSKFFWEKFLPDWMTWRRDQKVAREKLLSQFRAPAIRAISELQGRIYVIVRDRGSNYEFVKSERQGEYYIESTAFLVARCYAWLEILREKMATFDYAELFSRLEAVTQGFSHGEAGFQFFWLEQREIGERMLRQTAAGETRCIGYSEFLDALRSAEAPACFSALKAKAERMLRHWAEEVGRLGRIQHALIETVNFIDPDGRWVPKNRREALNVSEIVKQLVKEGFLPEAKGEKLLAEAREMEASGTKEGEANLAIRQPARRKNRLRNWSAKRRARRVDTR